MYHVPKSILVSNLLVNKTYKPLMAGILHGERWNWRKQVRLKQTVMSAEKNRSKQQCAITHSRKLCLSRWPKSWSPDKRESSQGIGTSKGKGLEMEMTLSTSGRPEDWNC